MIDLTVEPRQIILEKLAVGNTKYLSPSMAADAQWSTWVEDFSRNIALSLNTYVLAQHLDSHTAERSTFVAFDVPATWWQHWKQDHRLGRWLAKRWPVKTTQLCQRVVLKAKWDQYAAFPEAKIVTHPELGQHRLWLTQDSEITTE